MNEESGRGRRNKKSNTSVIKMFMMVAKYKNAEY